MVRRAAPVRTCVGCRRRAPAAELLRVVADERGADQVSIVPDPAHRRPGRGAHLHPDRACLALAVRRRSFGRALRVTGVVDAGPLVEYLGDGSGSPPGDSRAETESSVDRWWAREPHPDSKVGRPT